MSYGLRNSLILLLVLTLFLVSGWGYISYFQQPKIEELEEELESKTSELNEKEQLAAEYPDLVDRYDNARYYIDNFEKILFKDNNEDRVFDFLNELNTGTAYTDFNFSFADSTADGEFGYITMNISGTGYYRYLVNFIRQIEYSQPLSKINALTLSPLNDREDYGRVDFSFTLESYYDRRGVTEAEYETGDALLASLHNPFYPLIRDVEPNEEDLVNVEESDVVALTANQAFIIDQNGTMQRLSENDEVYLGRLQTIDMENRTVTFRLNKGGIVETVTVEVDQ